MTNLTPEMLDKGTAKDIQKAMRKDLDVAAARLKGKPVWFVYAGGVQLSDKKKIALFIVSGKSAEAEEWRLKLKTLNPKPTSQGHGRCTLGSKDNRVRIGVGDGAHLDLYVNAAQAAFMDKRVSVFDVKGDKADSKAAQAAAGSDKTGAESEGSEAQGEEGDR